MKKIILASLLSLLMITTIVAQQVTEGFETWPSVNWNLVETVATNPTTQSSTFAHTGTYSLKFSSMASSTSYDKYLVSNEINWTELENEFSFYYRKGSSGTETIKVGWSTTTNDVDNDFTWTETISPTSTWVQYLNSTLPAETKYVAIHYFSDYQYYTYIDDVVLGNVLPGTPEAPTLSLPANYATDVAADGDLEWTLGNDTSSIKLYLNDDEDFTGVTAITLTNADLSYTTSLDYSTTYYWKVVAVGPTAIETSSEVWSFTTEIDPATPVAPTLTAPMNNYQIATIDQTLSWTNGAETTSTNLHFSENSDFSEATIVTGVTSPYTPDPLWEYSTKYYWKVEAIGSTNISTFSLVRNFTVIDDPSTPEAPTLVAPTDYATDQAGTTQLTWTNNENTTSTNLYIATDLAFTTPIEVVGATSPYTPDPEWEYSTQYYWKVEAIGPTGLEVESDIRRFTTMEDPATPEAPTLDLPANNATNVAIDGNLTWTVNGTNTDYTVLYIATDNLFADIVYSGTQTTPYTTSLDNGTTYYWKVVAVGTTDIEVASDVRSFTTMATTVVVTEVAPYEVDFETWPPTDWTLSSTGAWVQGDGSSHGPGAANMIDGSYAAMFNNYSYSTGTIGSMTTPPLDLSGLTTPRVNFQWWNNDGIYTPAHLKVYTKIADGAWTEVQDIETISSGSTTWVISTNDITSDVTQIKLEATSDYGSFNTYVDAFSISEAPTTALVEISPDVKAFGEVNIGYSATQTFTVANNGVIAASIFEISVPTGFSYVSSETTPFSLEANSSFTVDVTFTPNAALQYSGNLRVKEAIGFGFNHDVALTGTGIPTPQGATFDNPLVLTFPAEDVTGTTEGFIDDYENDWVDTNPYYLDGNDVVYQFELTQGQLLTGSIVTTDRAMGVFILQEEPNETTPATVLLSDYSGYDGTTISFTNEFLPAGVYYLIISSSDTYEQTVDYTINATIADIPIPTAATYPSPSNEATGQATALTLDWNNPNYTEWVEIWFGEAPEVDPELTSRSLATRDMELLHTSTTAIEEYAVTGLDSGVTYNWKVISHNYSGSTPAEDVVTWSFTTIAEAPEAVTYTAPSNGALDRPLNGNLSWNSATGANGYNVYLSTDNTFAGVTPVDQTATTYAFTGLEYSTTYYWKVIPYNVVGSPEEGILTWSFTTMDDPTIPMPITIDFEDDDVVEETITLHNLTVGIEQGSTSNIMTKNIYGSTSNSAYIQFQAMGNITENAVFQFAYRFVDYSYSGPWAGIDLTAGYDYLTAKVSLDNGVTFTTIGQVNSENHVTSGDFVNYSIDISTYSGQTAIFRLDMPWNSGYSDTDFEFNIDNIYFGEPIVAPIVAISTTDIDFETVGINTTVSEVVTISNTGGGTLNISTIEIVGTNSAEFSATTETGASMALTVGQSLAIAVEFAPVSEGEKEATLQITDDMGAKYRINSASRNSNRTLNTVALSGSCVDPIISLFPFTEGFEVNNTDASTTVTSWTQDGDGEWTINSTITEHNRTPRTGSYNVTLEYGNDSWLMRPAQLVGGQSYDVSLYARQDASSGCTLDISYGTDATIASMETITGDVNVVNGEYQMISGTFVPETSGIYYIGINADLDYTPWYLSIDDISVIETPTIPVVSLSTNEFNFGDIELETTSEISTLTITNVGHGTLTVNTVEITGTDASLFAWEYADEEPVMALGNNESLDINVTFTPDALGEKTATLVITDDLGGAKNIRISSASKSIDNTRDANNVILTGTGWVPPQGSTCSDPLFLTLPAVGVTGTTDGFVDDYEYNFISPTSYYLGGNDIAYQFTLAQGALLNGTITTTDTYLGAFIVQEEPNTENPVDVIAYDTSSSTEVEFENEFLPAGTYFLIISNYPVYPDYLQSIDFTINLTADPIPAPGIATNPSPADAAIDQATGMTLSWTNANYTETVDLWIGVAPEAEATNRSSLVSTREMELVLNNVSVTDEYVITGLLPNTTYNWKVVNRNYSGINVETPATTWSFTTVGNAPAAVTYTAPADASISRPLSGSLTWSAATGADGYRVYLSTDMTFVGVNPVDQTTRTYAYSGLEYSTTYYWKVLPYNVVGEPTEGVLVWSFTTMDDPTIPMPITIDFEGTTSNPAAITLENFTIGTNQHGNTGYVMYKNVYYGDGYINFQSMNNITATSVIEFDYRMIDYDSPYPAIELEEGIDYFIAKVSTDNGANYTAIDQINSLNASNSDAMASYTIDVGAYAGQSVMFRFEMIDDLVNDFWFDIDNIFFGEPATEPILAVSTTELDFGTVYVGGSANDEVTITNEGVGTLNISGITIAGDNPADYSYSTEAEASMALGEDESLTITVTFAPTANGERNAELQFTDEFGAKYRLTSVAKTGNVDRAVNSVTLTGTGFTPAQGSVWENPLALSFPANVTGNTADYGDDYSSGDITGGSASTSYMNGDDVVYQFTADTDILLNGLINGSETYLGAFILADAPNATSPAQVVHSIGAGSGYLVEYDDVLIPAGTYYLIISTWSTPQSTEYTMNLTATMIVPIPLNVVMDMSADAISITWDEVAMATSYNVYGCDTPDGEYVLIEPVAGTEFTATAADMMKFYKVRAVVTPVAKGSRRN